MRRLAFAGFTSTILIGAVGCGKIEFGPGQTPQDAGPVVIEDTGPEPEPDAGVVDVGPQPDTGVPCRDLSVPAEGTVMGWKFTESVEAYRVQFNDWAVGAGCALGPCHGEPTSNKPYIPPEDSVTQGFTQGIGDLSVLLTGPAPSGGLWSKHHPNSPDQEAWEYTADQISYLESFELGNFGCELVASLASQDAGPNCGPDSVTPSDSGVVSDPDGGEGDGGGLDAGAMPDSGDSVDFELCYCAYSGDISMIDRTYCPNQ